MMDKIGIMMDKIGIMMELFLGHAPRPSRRILIRRLLRNGALVAAFVLGAIAIGAAGYHTFGALPWLDAALNAAMILTGMGPVNPIVTTSGKVFAMGYALFSGVFFLTMVAVLLAPALQHFLHRFHLELGEQGARAIAAARQQTGIPPAL